MGSQWGQNDPQYSKTRVWLIHAGKVSQAVGHDTHTEHFLPGPFSQRPTLSLGRGFGPYNRPFDPGPLFHHAGGHLGDHAGCD